MHLLLKSVMTKLYYYRNPVIFAFLSAIFILFSCDEMDPLPEPEEAAIHLQCLRSKNMSGIEGFRFILKSTDGDGNYQFEDTLITSTGGILDYPLIRKGLSYRLETSEQINDPFLVPHDMRSFGINSGDSIKLVYTKKKLMVLRIYNKEFDTVLDKCSGYLFMEDPAWPYMTTDIKWNLNGPDADTSFSLYMRPERKYFVRLFVNSYTGNYHEYTEEIVPTEGDTVFYTIGY